MNVYGTVNGIKIGTVWENRIECSRAGVHIPLDSDIHTGSNGLYSLLLCGVSKDNLDYGECITCNVTILKCKLDFKNENNVRENQKLLLSKNYESGNPIRVIRSSDLQSPYAATKGFRYDGLYVVKKLFPLVSDDGCYTKIKYSLRRRENQPIPPWREEWKDEIPSSENSSVVISPVREGKDSATKTQEKNSANTDFCVNTYESECDKVKDPLFQSKVIQSCLKKSCSLQKKCVTFEEDISMKIRRNSFKEYISLISSKSNEVIDKPVSKSSVNVSSVLSKIEHLGPELYSKKSCGLNSSSTSEQPEMKEKTEEKSSTAANNLTGDCLEMSSKETKLQQQSSDSNHITTDVFSSTKETEADKEQNQQAKERIAETKINTSIESSSSSSKVEKICRKQISKENSMGSNMINSESTGNDARYVELHQAKDSLNVKPKESSQDVKNKLHSRKRPKGNTHCIVESKPSSSGNPTDVDFDTTKQDSVEISSGVKDTTSKNSESKQNSAVVDALLNNSPCCTSESELTNIQPSKQNPVIESVNISDSCSSGGDFGKSVNSLCLQLSEIESKQYKTGTRSKTSSHETRKMKDLQEQNLEKSNSVLPDKKISESKNINRKRRKHIETFIDSEIISPISHQSKQLMQNLNIMNYDQMYSCSDLKANNNCLSHERQQEKKVNDDDDSHDTNKWIENKSNERFGLHSNKDSSVISKEGTALLQLKKLIPVVNLTRISNKRIKEICNKKKNSNSKENSRKRKHTSSAVKGKKILRECYVALKRLPVIISNDRNSISVSAENDTWYGWDVYNCNLGNVCNADLLTISDGNTQSRTVIWREDNQETEVENHSTDIVPDQLCEDVEGFWQGWTVITAYTDIDSLDDESGFFHGW